MSQSHTTANAQQIEYWNATVGDVWATYQAQLDRQIEPLGLAAMSALAPAAGEKVLDVGCGCGQTTWMLAGRVGPSGAVLGVDISEPMLGVARARNPGQVGKPPEFRKLDAQTGYLGAGRFDAAFSRFGVMFFEDPRVAFTNIRASLRAGGRMAFVCWRPLAENIWMRGPLEAALPLLPPLAPPDPRAPGPFAFADAGRLRSFVEGAGFKSVSIETFDQLIGGNDVDQTLKLAFRLGPLGAAVREHPHLAEAAAAAVRQVLEQHLTPDGVMMPAAVWIVRARNG